MITNATLTRVDVPAAATTAGDVSFVSGSAISVRGCLDEPTSGQKYLLGDVAEFVTAVLYVEKSKLPAGVTLAKGYMASVTSDDGASERLLIEQVKDRVKGTQSHFEVYLRAL